jgi:hypothetical protein
MRTNRALQSHFGKMYRKVTLFGNLASFLIFFHSLTILFKCL